MSLFAMVRPAQADDLHLVHAQEKYLVSLDGEERRIDPDLADPLALPLQCVFVSLLMPFPADGTPPMTFQDLSAHTAILRGVDILTVSGKLS
jgi:hypothetical protein